MAEAGLSEYFPTLRKFAQEVLQNILDTAQEEQGCLKHPIEFYEKMAAAKIFCGFNEFWKKKFPFEKGVTFAAILTAAEDYKREEQQWFLSHDPLGALTDAIQIQVVVAPKGVRKVEVVKAPSIDNSKPVDEDHPMEEMDDILMLDDEEPLPEPRDNIKERDCRKCGEVGHLAKDCVRGRDRAIYWRNRAIDPKFNEREKERKRQQNKRHRQKKRRIAAIIRKYDALQQQGGLGGGEV